MSSSTTHLRSLERLSAKLAELGVRADGPFADPDIVTRALTHSSFAAEQGGQSNERLEMLGDAILGFAVAEMLFDLFPDAPEGVLTRLRASLVDEESLARKARLLDLGSLLAMGRGEQRSGGRERDSALADALEAVVAGLYRSEGLPIARTLAEKLFREEARERGALGLQPDDFKTALQERAQASWKTQPAYRIVETTGPDHERLFTAEVSLGAVAGGRGEGRSKKIAEQQAARAALGNWDQLAAEYEATRTADAVPPRRE